MCSRLLDPACVSQDYEGTVICLLSSGHMWAYELADSQLILHMTGFTREKHHLTYIPIYTPLQ